MLDKRYKHSLRITSPFYLYKKYPQSGIFYVRFLDGKTVSTKTQDIVEAYNFAINYTDQHQIGLKQYLLSCSGNDFTRQRIVELLDVDDCNLLTKPKLYNLQEDLLELGLSGKSVNNYISIFHGYIKPLVKKGQMKVDPFIGLEKVHHTKKARKCLPIVAFKNFDWNKDKYSLLAYAAITTGARRGELMKLEKEDIIAKDDYFLLHIRGTKTENADRTVPISSNVKDCLLTIINNNLANDSNIRDVAKVIANRLGFDDKYVEDNGICFHSYRKIFKTILTSANLNKTIIETFIGHSTNNQDSNDVERIYFVAESADLSGAYVQVLKAMRDYL